MDNSIKQCVLLFGNKGSGKKFLIQYFQITLNLNLIQIN